MILGVLTQEETGYAAKFLHKFWCQKCLFFGVRNIEGQNHSGHPVPSIAETLVNTLLHISDKILVGKVFIHLTLHDPNDFQLYYELLQLLPYYLLYVKYVCQCQRGIRF